VAVKRAELTGAQVVLGSATPSLESYTRALQGGYKLCEMRERVNKSYPAVHVLDMRLEMQRGNTSLFAVEFQNALARTVSAGHQAILFLNRRGFSSFVSCRRCGHVCSCENCRVNFTYHARPQERLLCHYCGSSAAVPLKCPSCESEHIAKTGLGTQRVEEEVRSLFPGVSVLRMDMDTTRGKEGHAAVLDAFRKGEAQVLIGTQMVAKGLDFPDVTFVGVVAADKSLYTGDFRAGEYTFQLLTQVAGRAGRAAAAGEVYLQTFSPKHYAITYAQNCDYAAFYKHEIKLRETMVYPPFSHVFSVMLTGDNEPKVIATLQKLAAIMEYVNTRDGKGRFEIIGFSPAFVSKIKLQYRWKILVKCKEEAPLVAFVIYCMKKLRESDPMPNMTTSLTLNPVSME
jgi:primosomal protein N' (replication factor Y)